MLRPAVCYAALLGRCVLGLGTFDAVRAALKQGGSVVLDDDIRVWSPLFATANASVRSSNASSPCALDGRRATQVLVVTAGLTVENVVVRHGFGDSGGGIAVLGGSLNLVRCVLASNAATFQGGALYASHGAVTVTDSVFRENTAREGGACFLQASSFTAGTHNTSFSGNSAVQDGGALLVRGGFLSFQKTRFAENSAVHGGGALVVLGVASTTCATCAFDANRAARGGAAYVESDVRFSSGTTFTKNVADLGAAVFAGLTATISFSADTTFHDSALNASAHAGVYYSQSLSTSSVNPSLPSDGARQLRAAATSAFATSAPTFVTKGPTAFGATQTPTFATPTPTFVTPGPTFATAGPTFITDSPTFVTKSPTVGLRELTNATSPTTSAVLLDGAHELCVS